MLWCNLQEFEVLGSVEPRDYMYGHHAFDTPLSLKKISHLL